MQVLPVFAWSKICVSDFIDLLWKFVLKRNVVFVSHKYYVKNRAFVIHDYYYSWLLLIGTIFSDKTFKSKQKVTSVHVGEGLAGADCSLCLGKPHRQTIIVVDAWPGVCWVISGFILKLGGHSQNIHGQENDQCNRFCVHWLP